MSSVGYLAMGWLADGNMQNGDYVIGYQNCVRAVSNSGELFTAPKSNTFALKNASFLQKGNKVELFFTRPLRGLTEECINDATVSVFCEIVKFL